MNVESGLVGDSILSRAAYGGGGYGYGNSHGGREFANDGSNAVRINRNEKIVELGHDFLSQQISDNADRNRDLASSQAQNARDIANRDFQQSIAVGLSQQLARGEDNQNANFNMLSREAAANAREAAKCCCEAQLLAATNQAKTDAGLAQILANQSCDVRVSDAVANAAQNAKLDTLLNDRGPHRGN